MIRRPRLPAAALAAILTVSACGPTIQPIPTVPSFALPSFDTPEPPDAGSAAPLPSQDAPVGPLPMTPLPADIVAAVDAVWDAPSHEARVDAATAMLASVGIPVSGEERVVATGAAGIVLAPEEVEILAAEAGTSQYRATLADFAQAFGGMSLLPPNDALAAELSDDWLEAAAIEPADGYRVTLDLGPLPSHLAAAVTDWVTGAIEHHGSSDPELVALTNAPLLLAELARRRAPPIDLGRPFSATDHRLGWLEIAILVAGLRSMLAGAEAAGIGLAPDAPPSVALATHVEPAPIGPVPPGQANPCTTLKQMIDSRVPLVSTYIGSYVGNQIKGFIQAFVNSLFGEATSFAKAVGQAFKVLGLLFKVQALIMIYSESKAEVTLDPSIYHKPDVMRRDTAALVEVGISEAAWNAAQQARQLSPFATALRVCARHLGLPVWQDLVDVGDAMAAWKVQWELSRGGAHVEIPTRDQFASGRFERSLRRASDHTAIDAITYNVRPERGEDHPGQEKTDTIEFCAHVYPKAPPSGFGTLQSAVGAGTALAGGAYSGLVAAIASLLMSWVTTVASIDDCGQATVSWHVPRPGTWHGTITATTTVSESASGVEHIDPDGVVTWASRTSINVVDRFYVSGNEDIPGSPFLMLAARQYTNGIGVDESTSVGTNIPRGCRHDFTNVQSSSGSWGFDADSTVTVMLNPDGTYLLSWSVGHPPEEVVLHGEENNQVDIHEPGPHCLDIGSGTFDRDFYPGPTSGSGGNTQIQGRIDPANPGSVLRGSATFSDDRSVTSIQWELIRDGPIRLSGP